MGKSYLFVPANRKEFIEKTISMNQLSLVLDLEDSVPPHQKAQARENIATLDFTNFGGSVFVRISSEEDAINHQEDVALMSSLNNVGCVLPKTKSRDQVQRMKSSLGKRKLILLIEDFRSLKDLNSILESDVFGVSLGLEDLLADIPYFNITLSDLTLNLKSELVKASLANSTIPIDSISTNYKDHNHFRDECNQSRRLGFQSKFVIHPNQVTAVNEILGPSKGELDWAISIMNKAEQYEGGYTKVDGVVLSPPILNKAARILESNE